MKIAPLGHHQLPDGEQHFEVAFLRLPVPPAVAFARLAREIRRARRSGCADMLEQALDLLAVFRVPFGGVFPAHPARVQHAVAQQAVVLDRHEAGLVRPVFEQIALGQMLVQPLRRVGAEAAEQNEIRAARHHVDRIDLQLRHAANRVEHVGLGGFAARRGQETLSGQMEGAGGG
jgi:hypothetical protein